MRTAIGISGGIGILGILGLLVLSLFTSPVFKDSSIFLIENIENINLGEALKESNGHALENHSLDSLRVECAIKSGKVIQIWRNPHTLRSALVCELISEDTILKRWGIQIREVWGKKVTSFVKNKMKRIEQIEKYLENSNYYKIWE